ncbi:hypothetical protein [Flavobacterium branchiicola]|uniref:Uncharacterized protein n=1 Tax=Flavobacterium branchiicola TaxID=1114875 RepID=A0ABV9PKP0_9FLAO|nr:hypothetical protein [Flavobacterium branchiicola]
MISLVLIPLFCFYHFYKVDAFKVVGCIDVSFPDANSEKVFLSIKRNYQKFTFNNSLIVEKEKLNDLEIALRKLNKENDTINGIQVHLGSKMQYEVYIRIMDIFAIEQMPNFMQYKNDFFLLMMPKPKPNKNLKKIHYFRCAYEEVNRDYFLEIRKREEFERNIALYKKNWLIFLGYLGLVLLNVLALVKFNKTRNYNQK